jgi:hypothetical protein
LAGGKDSRISAKLKVAVWENLRFQVNIQFVARGQCPSCSPGIFCARDPAFLPDKTDAIGIKGDKSFFVEGAYCLFE